MWANSPSFCLSSSETLSTANSHPISWKSAQQLRNSEARSTKVFLAQQGSSSLRWLPERRTAPSAAIHGNCRPWKAESISDTKYCILVIPYPTFMMHFNFGAKAKLSEKGSMKVSYWDGLVIRMDAHLDHTWNRSVCFTQRAIHVPFFFPSVLWDSEVIASPEDQRLCLVSLCVLRCVNIVILFVHLLFWRNLAEFLT